MSPSIFSVNAAAHVREVPRDYPGRHGRALFGVTLITLALAAAFLAAGCAGAGRAADPTIVEARALPAGMVEHYRYIASHRALAEQVPCYCGCGKTLAHRFLRDCFVRDDGRYDAHAKGCGVCLAEATEVRRMEEAGMDASSIATAIDGQFSASGPPTGQR